MDRVASWQERALHRVQQTTSTIRLKILKHDD